MAVIVNFGNDIGISDTLYKNKQIYEDIINLSEDSINYDNGYLMSDFIPVDFSTPVKRYILFTFPINYKERYKMFDDIDECNEYIEGRLMYEHWYYRCILVDVSKLKFNGSSVNHSVVYVKSSNEDFEILNQ